MGCVASMPLPALRSTCPCLQVRNATTIDLPSLTLHAAFAWGDPIVRDRSIEQRFKTAVAWIRSIEASGRTPIYCCVSEELYARPSCVLGLESCLLTDASLLLCVLLLW